MPTPKGYSSTKKEARGTAEHATVELIRNLQAGLSVLSHSWAREVATDTIEASSTTTLLNLTGHAAQVGDVINWTGGTLIGTEVKVQEVTTNTVTLAEPVDSTPGLDTIQILRHKYPIVNAAGELNVSVAAGNLQFLRNGGDQIVTEDTATPANNRPLPVSIQDVSGGVTLNAANLHLDVQLDHDSANPDSIRVGDGVETLEISASGEASVVDSAARTSLASLDTKAVVFDLDTVGTENVPGVTLRTEGAGGSVEAGTLADPLRVDPTGTTTQPVSAVSLPLPTGAATEATLSTLNGKVTAVDTDSVTISAALPAGSNNIGDVDIASALPAGSNNIGDVDIASALPAGANTIGAVNLNRLDVVDLLDDDVLDTSSSNIPASASLPLEVVTSTSAAVEAIQIYDTTGEFLGLFTGAAAAEVLVAIIGPGTDQSLQISIPISTRLSLRNIENSVIAVGKVAMNLMG